MLKSDFLNKLFIKFPDRKHIYDYSSVTEDPSWDTMLEIDCCIHGRFIQKCFQHMHGSGCPVCGNDKSRNSRIEKTGFKARSINKFGSKFSYENTNFRGLRNLVQLKCPEHGEFTVIPKWHLRSETGCQKCEKTKQSNDQFFKVIDRANKLYDFRYDYSEVKYINFTDKVKIKCPRHGVFLQSFMTHLASKIGCKLCSLSEDKIPFEKFIERAIKTHGNRYDYSRAKDTYRGLSYEVTINCNKHGEFIQRAGSHLSGSRCRDCYIEDTWIDEDTFVKKAIAVHGNKFDYSLIEYRGSKTKLEVLCPKHGSFWVKPNSHISSRAGCKKCKESKGERAVSVLLDNLGINYIQEYKLPSSLYRYDFYLPDFDIYIEFHGNQHFHPVRIFGGVKEWVKRKENDLIKAELVHKHGGKLIELSFESIKNKTLEQDLINGLRKAIPYWIKINGKAKAFTRLSMAYEYFDVPRTIQLSELLNWVSVNIKDTELI